MAKFEGEISLENMEILSEDEAVKMFDEMAAESAELVCSDVRENIRKAFSDSGLLEKGLYISKVYRNSAGDVVCKIGFSGYAKNKDGKEVPIPLVAMAREYGTMMGEKKVPFFRKSFNKKKIDKKIEDVQKRHIPE